MIPILSDSYPMTGNGLGGLSDAISCVVTNEINGEYELRMRYPVTGEHYSEMLINYFIMATPGMASAEPFRIYRITRPLNGVVTVYARHLSYDMSGIIVEPCSASSLTEALTTIPSHAVPSCPFTLASTRTVASPITVVEPKTLWGLLGGSAGSFLDVYGGEWEFSGYTATLKTTLGTDRGVEIRYGKNLTQLETDADISATYGGVYPYWYDEEEGLVTGSIVPVTGSIYTRILLLDCSSDFDTKPTSVQLQTRAANYITANSVGSPKDSWKVSFALLAQSKEYETQAILEQVQLGDTVKVKYDALGVNATARAVKTEWDVLGDKYESITIGRVKQNLASILVGQNREQERALAQTKSALEQTIASSTDFIKNGTGVMRFIYNSDGDLMEIVSLDDADISQAQSVWRWNNGGFGHSSTGYSGQYTTAITQDGQIVADFITTGTLNAARVKAGILSDNAGKNSWNLDTGAFTITEGSINITTNNESQDIIQFNGTSANGGTFSAVMQPISFEIHNDYPRDTGGGRPQVIDDILISSTNRSAYIWVKRTQYSYNNPQYPYRTEYVETGPNHISLHRDIYQLGEWTASATSEITPSSFVLQQPRTLTDGALVTNLMSLGDSSLTFRDLATAYERIKLDNTGLTFRDANNAVKAQYLADQIQINTYDGSKPSFASYRTSGGAGELILFDGSTAVWRAELGTGGLFFRDTSSNVTASYPATGSTSNVDPTSGWTRSGGCYLYRLGNMVSMFYAITGGTLTASAWNSVGSIPVDYRPHYNLNFPALDNANDTSVQARIIGATGILEVFAKSGIHNDLRFYATWII